MIYRVLGFLILMSVLYSSCAFTHRIPDDRAENQIRAVMAAQEKAWSDGDIDAFMQGYHRSRDLLFVGSKGLSKGWETTLNNYKKGYPDRGAMGRLKFDILEMKRLGSRAYLVIGTYELIRKNDHPKGIFSLVWQYIDGRWVIVCDHTS